jgi:hypothetical protein
VGVADRGTAFSLERSCPRRRMTMLLYCDPRELPPDLEDGDDIYLPMPEDDASVYPSDE